MYGRTGGLTIRVACCARACANSNRNWNIYNYRRVAQKSYLAEFFPQVLVVGVALYGVSVGGATLGLVDLVDGDFKGVILSLEHKGTNHSWDQLFEKRTAFFETRVCVYFDQVHVTVLVHHEVVAKDLELVLPSAYF